MENQSNKAVVARFYKQVIGNRNASLIPVLVSEDYIQHSPAARDGRQGLTEMVAFLKRLPPATEMKSPVRMLIADDDLVAGLLDIEFMGKRMLVVDLFRLEEGMLAEHWDASEEAGADVHLDTIEPDTIERKAVNKAFIIRLFETGVLFKDLQSEERNLEVRLMRIIGQGDIVVTQSALITEGKLYAQYDIFRVTNEAITKRWSVRQLVPEKMPHHNGML